MKKKVVLIFIIFMTLISMLSINNISFAGRSDGTDSKSEQQAIEEDIKKKEVSYGDYDIGGLLVKQGDPKEQEVPLEFKNIISKVLGAIVAIGAMITVIVIAFIGFQYVTGSVQDVAEIKSRFGGILIGVIFMMFAVEIVKFVVVLM